VTVSLSVSG